MQNKGYWYDRWRPSFLQSCHKCGLLIGLKIGELEPYPIFLNHSTFKALFARLFLIVVASHTMSLSLKRPWQSRQRFHVHRVALRSTKEGLLTCFSWDKDAVRVRSSKEVAVLSEGKRNESISEISEHGIQSSRQAVCQIAVLRASITAMSKRDIDDDRSYIIARIGHVATLNYKKKGWMHALTCQCSWASSGSKNGQVSVKAPPYQKTKLIFLSTRGSLPWRNRRRVDYDMVGTDPNCRTPLGRLYYRLVLSRWT